MTSGTGIAPVAVSAGEAEKTVPYPGEDPTALDTVAGRLTHASELLAAVTDRLIDTGASILPMWRGVAARCGSAEIDRIRRSLDHGTERLSRARRALFDCADGLRAVRAGVDLLRHDWRCAEGTVRTLDTVLPVTTDPARQAELAELRRAAQQRREHALDAWRSAVGRADALSLTCRSQLVATISGDQVFVQGRGVITADLGSAMGVVAGTTGRQFEAHLDGPKDDATRWAALGPEAQLFALTAAGSFPAAAHPALRAAWWSSRRWSEQQAVLHADPKAVGAADGLPVAARDQANRLYLDSRESTLRAALAAGNPALAGAVAGFTGPLGPGPTGGAVATSVALAGLRHELATITQIRLQLGSPRSQPLYLVGVDPARRGRAVVSMGDPDTSDTVATYVPGVGSDVTGLGDELNRLQAWADGTADHGGGTIAAVVWLGYESPPTVLEAGYDRAADTAGPALELFQQGLRASHLGPTSRNVVVAHSYGALAVAAAATGPRALAADGLMLVAPVGMEVGSVADLHLVGVPPEAMGDRVRVLLHRNDPIRFTTPVHPGAPFDGSFGARVLVTEPVGADNNGRWLPGSASWAYDWLSDEWRAHSDYQAPGSAEQRAVSAFLADARAVG